MVVLPVEKLVLFLAGITAFAYLAGYVIATNYYGRFGVHAAQLTTTLLLSVRAHEVRRPIRK